MPRVGLTRSRVAAVAADLADETGLESLSLSAVAKHVGVSQPALYKHVPGLDALRRDVAVLAVDELTAVLRAARAGRHGRDALHAVCDAYRRYAAEHPGRAAASVRAPAPDDPEHTAAGTAAAAELLAVLADYGIGDGAEGVHAVRQVRACLHGFVALEAGGGFGLPESVGETFTRLVDALDVAFTARSALGEHGQGPAEGADQGEEAENSGTEEQGGPREVARAAGGGRGHVGLLTDEAGRTVGSVEDRLLRG